MQKWDTSIMILYLIYNIEFERLKKKKGPQLLRTSIGPILCIPHKLNIKNINITTPLLSLNSYLMSYSCYTFHPALNINCIIHTVQHPMDNQAVCNKPRSEHHHFMTFHCPSLSDMACVNMRSEFLTYECHRWSRPCPQTP